MLSSQDKFYWLHGRSRREEITVVFGQQAFLGILVDTDELRTEIR
jgi:hypothetical protein